MRISDMIMIILLTTLLFVVCYGIYHIKDEGMKCMTNPLPYGIRQLEKNYGEIGCSCSKGITINSSSVYVHVELYKPDNPYFNKEGE